MPSALPKIIVRLPEDLHALVEKEAEAAGVSLSAHINAIVAHHYASPALGMAKRPIVPPIQGVRRGIDLTAPLPEGRSTPPAGIVSGLDLPLGRPRASAGSRSKRK